MSSNQPSLPWRAASSLTMGITGIICRSFLYGFNKTEVVGLERFLELLDSRKDVEARNRGLITVSNHICVLDDPLIWGVLPTRYSFSPENHRWSLGSHDLCFQNKATSSFFTFGQVLPTHRKAHSQHGGLFQPTMTQVIRLLSSQPFPGNSSTRITDKHAPSPSSSLKSTDLTDPFTSNHLIYPSTYSTNGTDTFPAPSSYSSRRYSWIHVFPEGSIHQHPSLRMRYFKWGISRMILESEPLPDIVPMFISGNEQVMHESRKFPRFIPRPAKKIVVAFGEKVDGERIFGDLRERWRNLVASHADAIRGQDSSNGYLAGNMLMGELPDELKYGDKAVELRKEVTLRVRMEVLKVRKTLGYPDEDPKEFPRDTRIEEGPSAGTEGRKNDGSWVKDI